MTRGATTLLTVFLLMAGCQRSAVVEAPPGCEAPAKPAAEPPERADDAAESPLGQHEHFETGEPDKAAVSNAEGAVSTEAAKADPEDDFQPLPPPDPELFPDLKRMSPRHDVWFDAEHKRVVMQSGVCLRRGPLEMFACIHQWIKDPYAPGGKLRRGTKEYESVVTINTTAALVHAALLAAGAEPGHPVRFAPEYQAATGTPIEVTLHWKDAQGERHQAPAQHWIKNTKTGEAMTYGWVFAGSGFWKNEQTGKEEYLAENGDLICVSNFSDAVLDLPVLSPQANNALLFEAFTERIPPMGTTVTVVLTPRSETKPR
jgi:hypothetical protein